MLNLYQFDPCRGEGEADSRVGSGGLVPNKPITGLDKQESKDDANPFRTLV